LPAFAEDEGVRTFLSTAISAVDSQMTKFVSKRYSDGSVKVGARGPISGNLYNIGKSGADLHCGERHTSCCLPTSMVTAHARRMRTLSAAGNGRGSLLAARC
jgi:hypothetical protein